jgi:hypothetical protein
MSWSAWSAPGDVEVPVLLVRSGLYTAVMVFDPDGRLLVV